LAYAIGVPRPVSIDVDTFNTGIVEDEKITRAIRNTFDLRPAAIIRDLGLNAPGYYALGAHGHFGDVNRTWEQSVKADELIDNLASVHDLLKVE
jgi:S-adenosylmethionine synthetase